MRGFGLHLLRRRLLGEATPYLAVTSLLPISASSQADELVATHQARNLPSGVTVSGWSLSAGGTVFKLAGTSNVTVRDVSGVSADQNYTIVATLSDATTLTLSVTVTWRSGGPFSRAFSRAFRTV